MWLMMGNSRYSRVENVKPRHMLTLKWRIKKGTDKSNPVESVIYSFIDFLEKLWYILSCEIDEEPSTVWRSLQLPYTVDSFGFSYCHHKNYVC